MSGPFQFPIPHIVGGLLALCGIFVTPLHSEEQPGIVTFTTNEDHQQMLRQLGITKLRPGANGNEKAPNHANYDENLANPFPDLPELLVCQDASVINTQADWMDKRRPEIVKLFEQVLLGRIPAHVPRVSWKVLEEQEITTGEITILEKTLPMKSKDFQRTFLSNAL